jgi:uncharacterized membrane protein
MRGFLLRFLGALVLVFATYNPEGHSFTHWVLRFEGFTPALALTGVLLTIAWVAVFTAAWRSLGFIMTGLVAALVAALLWMLVDKARGSLSLHAVSYLALIGIAFALAVAMSWSTFRRGWSARSVSEEKART